MGVAAMRERSKKRLDATYDAAMITRALTGKGADKLYAALKRSQQALTPDLDEPWTTVVRADSTDINYSDGWGHSHQDDSVEGIMREVEGMTRMDRHEQFMDKFYNHQIAQAQRQEAELEASFRKAIAEVDMEDHVSIMSHDDLQALERRIQGEAQARDSLVADTLHTIHAAEERREARAEGN